MELVTAIRLIEKGVDADTIQTWTDLGAGDGMFTKALAKVLKPGSSITAVDKKRTNIIIESGVNLQIKKGDFTDLDFENSDGILMANALHYVKDQKGFLEALKAKTKRVVLVEYNTDKGNMWVPYPISFKKLETLVSATKLHEAPSAYHKEGIYSALITV